MKRFIDGLTKPFFSLLEVIVLMIWVLFTGNAALFSLRNLIMFVILLPVLFATFFIEEILRKRAGLQKWRKESP